jgi:hypothetical protein
VRTDNDSASLGLSKGSITGVANDCNGVSSAQGDSACVSCSYCSLTDFESLVLSVIAPCEGQKNPAACDPVMPRARNPAKVLFESLNTVRCPSR